MVSSFLLLVASFLNPLPGGQPLGWYLQQDNKKVEQTQSDENPDLQIPDPTLEKRAAHNVEVAEFYLKKRKAYKASVERLMEIVIIYPQYSRMDKVLYLLAQSYVGLKDAESAQARYKELIENHPKSELLKSARKELEKLK